jgi:hypothetical protein
MDTRGLPDGGELEYPRHGIVQVGDRGLPRFAVYRHPGGDGEPAFEVRIEVWDGVPVCTEVKVSAKPGDRTHVRAKDLKLVAFELENSIEYWLSELAFTRHGKTGWKRGFPKEAAERQAARTSIRKARQQVRRKMTDGHLQKVAETYRAGGPNKTEAVAVAFGVSPRTASRYVQRARDARLLPPATRQGTKA